MARGKNYVNNNRGLHLQSGKNKSNNTMRQCEYGPGCTRPDCIYRHDEPKKGAGRNGIEPVCVLFLAGKCAYKDKGCRKRHPGEDEAARLLAKYKKIRCHHGDDCYTDSCLFLHPKDMKDQDPVAFIEPHHFPPLNGIGGRADVPIGNQNGRPVPNSAWNAAPVGAISSGKSSAGPNEVEASTQQTQQLDSSMRTESGDSQQQSEMVREEEQPSQIDHPQQYQGPPPPSNVWGYSPHGPPPHHQNGAMMMPSSNFPPQGYYGGPAPTMIDPSTGYPVAAYYEGAQQQNGMMYSPMPHYAGYAPYAPYGPMMGTPFNAEAKEFVPERST